MSKQPPDHTLRDCPCGPKRHGTRQLSGERTRHGAWRPATGLILRRRVAGFYAAVDRRTSPRRFPHLRSGRRRKPAPRWKLSPGIWAILWPNLSAPRRNPLVRLPHQNTGTLRTRRSPGRAGGANRSGSWRRWLLGSRKTI